MISANAEAEENWRVPVFSDRLISFLVQMRASYPLDERFVNHWHPLMDQTIRQLRLELDMPVVGRVHMTTKLTPSRIIYVPLADLADGPSATESFFIVKSPPLRSPLQSLRRSLSP